jgi:hypothetical protein
MNLNDIETSRNIKVSWVTYKSYYKTKICDKNICEDRDNCFCAHSPNELRLPNCIAYYIGRCKNIDCKFQHTTELPKLPINLYCLLAAKLQAREVQIEKESDKYRNELEKKVEKKYRNEFDREVEKQVEKELKKKRKRSESKERKLYKELDDLEDEVKELQSNSKKLNNTIVFLENEIIGRDNHINNLNQHINNLTHQLNNSFQQYHQPQTFDIDPRITGLFSLLRFGNVVSDSNGSYDRENLKGRN